jgi:hypothetical protein
VLGTYVRIRSAADVSIFFRVSAQAPIQSNQRFQPNGN